MRDEDLKALPQSIDRHRFSELMQAVGFKAGWENHTRDLRLDRDGLHVVVYATDADGKRYFHHEPTEIEVTELGEKEPTTVRGPDRAEAAVHEISIPFSGWWTKPEEHDSTAPVCGNSYKHDATMLCTRATGHAGAHMRRGETWI